MSGAHIERFLSALEVAFFESVSLSTVHRWCRDGIGEPRVRLESHFVGGKRYIPRLALQEFLATAYPKPPTPNQRQLTLDFPGVLIAREW